jgi:hypothetical protein
MESSLEEQFFQPRLPKDSHGSSYSTFLAHVDNLEETCARTIHGKPPVIAVVQEWFGDCPWLNCNDPTHRQAPAVVHHSMYMTSGSTKITLEQPLQVGWGKLAQVWKGKMALTAAPEVPPAVVCVKNFQESMYVDLDTEDSDSCDSEWKCGAQQARREAWAYSAMTSIQGICACLVYHSSSVLSASFLGCQIPWSYGFFEVYSLPNFGSETYLIFPSGSSATR